MAPLLQAAWFIRVPFFSQITSPFLHGRIFSSFFWVVGFFGFSPLVTTDNFFCVTSARPVTGSRALPLTFNARRRSDTSFLI